MHIDAANKAKLEIDVPWDEMRAARVQKRALEGFRKQPLEECPPAECPPAGGPVAELEIEEPVAVARPSKRWLSSPWVSKRVRYALLAAICSVAAVIALVIRFDALGSFGGARPPAWAVTSTLHYADGSRSLLSAQAQVDVIEDREQRVEVAQNAGRVRYEIKPRPERRFVVGALGVTITVLGTVFDVNVEGDQVEVVVEHGRVRVEHGGRTLELTDGEHVIVVGSKLAAVHPPHLDDPDRTDGTRLIEEGTESNKQAPAPTASAETKPTAAEWMRRADAARAGGRLDEAMSALQSLLAAYPGDPRATLALFTMGRVERQRGNHAASATAFEQCGAALRGDAFAEAAASWLAAGQGGKARAAAQRYLSTFPTGVHAEQMRKLVGSQ